MPDRAMIYTRVSTKLQKDNFSHPQQEEACLAYCEKNGYEVVGTFHDDHTGTELSRPALNELRKQLSKTQANKLVVLSIDRLGRKQSVLLQLEEEFSGMIEYVTMRFEKDRTGRFTKRMMMNIAELERDTVVERMQEGRLTRAKAGNINPGKHVTYGYQYISGKHTGKYEIDPITSEIVRNIFEWCIAGQSTIDIAKKLTEQGVKPPTSGRQGKPQWWYATVNHILHNHTYTGTNTWAGISIPVPAIIDQDTFDLAQSAMDGRKKSGRNNIKTPTLAGGRCYCIHCKGLMLQKNSHNRIFFTCKGVNKNLMPDRPCSKYRTIKADELDFACWSEFIFGEQDGDWTLNDRPNPPRWVKAVNALTQSQDHEKEDAKRAIDYLQPQLKSVASKIDRILTAVADGTISNVQAKSKLSELEAEQKELAAKLEDAKFKFENAAQIKKEMERRQEIASKIVGKLARAGDDITFDQKLQVLDLAGAKFWVERFEIGYFSVSVEVGVFDNNAKLHIVIEYVKSLPGSEA